MQQYGREVTVSGKSYLVLDLNEMVPLVDELGKKIEKEYTPSSLVGCARWGNDVSNLLSDILEIESSKVFSIGISSYSNVDISRTPRVHQELNVNLEGEDVLVVDELVQTGETLRRVADEVTNRNPKSSRTAALYIKHARYVPNFWIGQTDKWIFFPWKRYENCMNLLEQIHSVGREICSEEMISTLLETFGYSEEVVERAVKIYEMHHQRLSG